MSFLSVCAICRNEADYLEEWVEFHLLQGVQHFYMYNNLSTDGTEDILKRYEKAGIVTYENIEQNPVQFVAYNKCLKDHGHESEWIAFIDVDEFLYSPEGLPLPAAIQDIIENALLRSRVAAVAVHWVLFGANGHKEKTDGLVIDRFTRREAATNNHVKSIVRPRVTESVAKNTHTFRLHKNTIPVDENGVHLPAEYALGDGTADILRIAHFHTKSYAEYVERKSLPDASIGTVRPAACVEEMFRAHDLNQVEDTSLMAFAEAIKQNIALRKIE